MSRLLPPVHEGTKVDESNGYTVAALADFLEVSKPTVRRWIARGFVKAERVGRQYGIPLEENRSFIFTRFAENMRRQREPYVPDEIRAYDEWHSAIDEICWLLKVCYSSPDSIKKRRFRLEALFQNFLKSNAVQPEKVARIFDTPSARAKRLVPRDLKRGWFNELSYVFPLKTSTLGVSFGDIHLNADATNARFAFPSWKIAQAYYSIYFYLRGITLQKLVGFRLEEHGSAISCFKNNLMIPLARAVWHFPLSIRYVPGKRVYRRNLPLAALPHTGLAYSRHPRPPHATPVTLFDNIYRLFRKRARAYHKATSYTLFDYLHDFRVWANYVDIDNLIRLWGKGYKGFLDQNLSLLTFFVGGIAELCYISVYGSDAYGRRLQELYDLFAANNPELRKNFALTPPWQRHQIFKAMGITAKAITIPEEKNLNELLLS